MKRAALPLLVLSALLALAACQAPAALLTPTLSGAPCATCATSQPERYDEFPGGPAVGGSAVDFTLRDTEGVAHTLSRMLAERPVLLIFGSFT